MGIGSYFKRRRITASSDVSSDFIHLVMTRHHIGAYNEKFLEYRQELFETLTLPSMDAQTERKFTWVLAIDRDMPEKYRTRLEDLVSSRPYIRLVELELLRDFHTAMRDFARREAKASGYSHVLSTRLDNDDALHKDLFAEVQRNARAVLAEEERLPALFAATTGCHWVPAAGIGHPAFRACPSAGPSLLSPVDDLVLAYEGPHSKLPNRVFENGGFVRAIDGGTEWWLHAITDTSLSKLQFRQDRRVNTLSNRHLREMTDDLLQPFGINSIERIRGLDEPLFSKDREQINQRIEETENEILELRKQIRKLEQNGGSEDRELLDRYAALHDERKKFARSLME